MNIAQNIISKLGGYQIAAEILKTDISTVYRWTYPKERGGTGGTIPAKQQPKILKAALEKGIEVSPADFFDMPKLRKGKP